MKVKLLQSCSGILLLLMIILLCGCSNNGVSKIVIPKDFFDYTGTIPEQMLKYYRDAEEKLYEDINVKDGALYITMTPEQKEKMIAFNNEMYKSSLTGFYSENPKYKVEVNEEYDEIKAIYNQEITKESNQHVLMDGVLFQGINYMLKNNTDKWKMKITVINCDTGKTVVEGTLPDEKIVCTSDDWNNSK